MSKFVLKSDPQQEVRIGDTITATRKTEFGTITVTREVTNDVIKELMASGVIIEIDSGPKSENTEMSVYDVICHLAKRIGWKPENLKKYIENLYTISPTAVYQILIKEIAIMIDKHYKSHISEVVTVYAVSMVDGEIFRIKKTDGKNYTNVALFRTYKEAELAKRVLMIIEADIF